MLSGILFNFATTISNIIALNSFVSSRGEHMADIILDDVIAKESSSSSSSPSSRLLFFFRFFFFFFFFFFGGREIKERRRRTYRTRREVGRVELGLRKCDLEIESRANQKKVERREKKKRKQISPQIESPSLLSQKKKNRIRSEKVSRIRRRD